VAVVEKCVNCRKVNPVEHLDEKDRETKRGDLLRLANAKQNPRPNFEINWISVRSI